MTPEGRPPIDQRGDQRGAPASWRSVLGLLAVTLAMGSLVMVSLERFKYLVIAQVAQGRLQPGRWLSAFGPLDAALAVLTLGLMLGLAIAEWRGRALTRLLLAASPAQSLAALTILLAWLGNAYLTPGVLLGGDTGTHIVRFMEVRRALEAGAFPHWTNDQFLGSPLLGFTGPLTYLLGGALDVLVQDGPTTAKLLLFSLHLCAGWAFFAFAQRLGISRRAAFVATLGFAGAFAHLHLFLYRGVFPQAFTILFLVLLFHTAEGLMRGVGSRAGNFLVFALVTAGLILNHQPHALFAAVYLGLFGAASILLGRWRIRLAPAMIVAGICGAAMSVYAVLPLLVEADWVMIQPEGALFGLRLPSAHRLGQLVLWRNMRTTWGIDYWAYLGLPFILLALAGLWRGLRDPSGRALVLAVLPCLALAFFLFNPVVRDVMFLLLFGGILAGLGMDSLLASTARRWAPLVALLLLADVSSTAIQPVARLDKDFLIAAGQYLERTAPGERIIEINLENNGAPTGIIGPNAGPISYRAAVARVAGHHNMAATRVHNYAATIIKRAETELAASGELGAGTRALLGMLNVTRIVCYSVVAMGCPASFRDTREEGPLGRVVPVTATPVLFAPRLVTLDPPAATDKPMLWDEQFHINAADEQVVRVQSVLEDWLRVSAAEPGTPHTAALPVRGPQRARGTDIGRWNPGLVRFRTTLQTTSVIVRTDRPGYIQLAAPWFPGNRVTINGADATPIQGTLGLIVLPIKAGTSVVEIAPFTTPIRHLSLLLTFAAMIATALAALWLERAGKRAPAA